MLTVNKLKHDVQAIEDTDVLPKAFNVANNAENQCIAYLFHK